jgi:hypothetical protein
MLTNPESKKKQILLALISLAITLGALEIGARIWLIQFATLAELRDFALYTDIPAEDLQWSPHPYLNYYPTPGYEDGLTSHNSLGYRGSDFPVEKPDGEYRIVALGGSTTYTIGVADNAMTFAAQLEVVLAEAGYDRVRVINAGAGGYTSWESLINLQVRILALDPDLILVYHGTNDVHARLVAPQGYQSDNTGRYRQWSPPAIPWFEHSGLLRILSRRTGNTRQVGLSSFVDSTFSRSHEFTSQVYSAEALESGDFSLPLLRQNPPIFFEQNLINMVAVSRANKVDILLATWQHSPYFSDYAASPMYQFGFEQNNAVVQQVGAATGTPVLDFAALMPQQTDYWVDGRHLNELGARLKAEIFAEFIIGLGWMGD